MYTHMAIGLCSLAHVTSFSCSLYYSLSVAPLSHDKAVKSPRAHFFSAAPTSACSLFTHTYKYLTRAARVKCLVCIVCLLSLSRVCFYNTAYIFLYLQFTLLFFYSDYPARLPPLLSWLICSSSRHQLYDLLSDCI